MKETEHMRILVKREKESCKEIDKLKGDLKDSNGQYLSTLCDLNNANEEIKSLKEKLDTKNENLDIAMMRNKELQEMVDDLKSDRYLRKQIASDRTKSKNIHEGVQKPWNIYINKI